MKREGAWVLVRCWRELGVRGTWGREKLGGLGFRVLGFCDREGVGEDGGGGGGGSGIEGEGNGGEEVIDAGLGLAGTNFARG